MIAFRRILQESHGDDYGRMFSRIFCVRLLCASWNAWAILARFNESRRSGKEEFQLLESDSRVEGIIYVTRKQLPPTRLHWTASLRRMPNWVPGGSLKNAQAELAELQKNKIGGRELERKNDIIEALMRMREERIAGNAELTRLGETESRLRKEFRSALDGKLGYACSDGDFECVARRDASSYVLEGENPFADLFSDWSRARFQKDFEMDANGDLTAALSKKAPIQSPEAIPRSPELFLRPGFQGA